MSAIDQLLGNLLKLCCKLATIIRGEQLGGDVDVDTRLV